MRGIALTILTIVGLSTPALASLPPHGGLLGSPYERVSVADPVGISENGSQTRSGLLCSLAPSGAGTLPHPTRPNDGGNDLTITSPLMCS